MGGASDLIFGSGKQQTDWESLMKIINLQTQLNRPDVEGFFTTNRWEEDADGNWTQSQELNPALQGGMDRLLARAGGHSGDFQNYQSPMQFEKLLQAKMANQYDQHGLTGLPGGGQIPSWQQGYGPQLKNQDRGLFPGGGDYSAMLPPAPPEGGAQGPGGGIPGMPPGQRMPGRGRAQ